MLGGGHGLLQGQHGLSADQLVSTRIVLSNGTAVTVSNTSGPDLFWALRGAGHNFDIVIEYTHQIHDARPNETFEFEQSIFSGNQLEQVYTVVNQMKKSQPAEVVEWGLITRMPLIDPVNVRVYLDLSRLKCSHLSACHGLHYSIQRRSISSKCIILHQCASWIPLMPSRKVLHTWTWQT